MPSGAFLSGPVLDIVVRMINIRGSYVGSRLDATEAIDFFARGVVKSPVKIVPLQELEKVYELMGWCPFAAALRLTMNSKENPTLIWRPQKTEQQKIAGRYVLQIPD